MRAGAEGIVFVCLGNICRSPTAEYVARAEFARAGIEVPVASRGMGGWHIGEPADARAVLVAREAGYDMRLHRARQFHDADFFAFARVLAVDGETLAILRRRLPKGVDVPERFLVAAGLVAPDAGAEGDVADPYTGAREDFELALARIRAGVAGLLERWPRTLPDAGRAP